MKYIGFGLSFLLLTMSSSAEALAAITIPLTVNLSETVTVTGTPQISVDVGGVTRTATYTSGTGTNALTFTLSPQVGDVDLDGISISSPIDLNGGTIKDNKGNDATLTFTPPNTANVKVNYPSLGMDFVYDADGRYTLNGTVYNDLTSFLTATGGSFTRATIGTYFDSSGILQTAASGVPRFDYDPVTHAPKGLLIEESKTNLLTGSSQMDGTMVGATASNNVTTAPDGANTADKLVGGNGISGRKATYKSYTVTSGIKYTFSVYLKKAEYSSATIWIDRTAITEGQYWGSGVTINLNNGTSSNPAVISVSSVGNGWYRCSLSATPNADWSMPFSVSIGFPNGGDYTGDGVSGIYVWGWQLEQGAFPTSYIPTNATSVTRAADNLVIGNSPAWLGSNSGALTLKATTFGSRPAWGYAQLWDGTTNNRIAIINSAGVSGNINAAGVNYVALGSATPAGLLSAGISYATNNVHLVYGGNIYTDTSAVIPVVNQLKVGGSSTGTTELNGWMQGVKYYPAKLSSAQMLLLTQ